MTTSIAEAPAGASSALAPANPGVLALVNGDEPWTVADLADKLAPAVTEPPELPFPKLPKAVELTKPLQAALRAIPALFGKVRPKERRALSDAEIAEITTEALAIKSATKPLDARLEEISEIIRNHQDAKAEQDGIAHPATVRRNGRVITQATPRIPSGKAKGHYLLARPQNSHETAVPGMEGSWQQRYVSGGTSLSQKALEKLLDDGMITRDVYLGFTREVRVLDEAKIAETIRKSPAVGLQVLAAITERSAPSAALYAPTKE